MSQVQVTSHLAASTPIYQSTKLQTHPTVSYVILPKIVDVEGAGKADGLPLDLRLLVRLKLDEVDIGPDRRSGVDLCAVVGRYKGEA